jgi:flagellar protein FlaG
MASVSVSSLVLFIASLVVAAAVAGTLVTEVDQITHSVTQSSDQVGERIETDVTIISDTGSDALYDADERRVRVLVKNTGSEPLGADAGQVDVLVDGTFVAAANVTVARADGTGGSTWAPGSVVRVDIDRQLDPGDHRVAVLVNGNEEVVRFRVD